MSKASGSHGARQGDAMALADEACQPELVDQVIERMNRRSVDPADVPAAVRQRCVSHLGEQGLTTSEIAQVLGVSERTVRRDRSELRREAGIEPDRALGDGLFGEFERVVSAANARLVRLARDPQTPAYARLWAEEAQVRNYQRLIDTAQRLKYVESGASRLEAQRLADRGEVDRLNAVVDRLRLLR